MYPTMTQITQSYEVLEVVGAALRPSTSVVDNVRATTNVSVSVFGGLAGMIIVF